MTRRASLLLLLPLAACTVVLSGVEPPLATSADIDLSWQSERYSLHAGLPPPELAALVDSLRRFGHGRLDALHVSVTGPGDLQRLRSTLEAAGVQPSELLLRRGPAPVSVFAARAVAVPSPCPALVIGATGFGPNLRRPGLGCTDVGNLAAQVADPADLLGNDANPLADGDRAANPVSRYRAGGRAAQPSAAPQAPAAR